MALGAGGQGSLPILLIRVSVKRIGISNGSEKSTFQESPL